MELDTTHDCWHGAYSAFSRWREKLAEVAGYDIVKLSLEEYGRTMTCVDWGLWPENAYYDPPYIPCRLDGTPDPLLLLIMHSDCEGKLRYGFLTPLAKRLEELLPQLDGEDGGGHIGDYGDKTRRFINGLRLAYDRNEDVEFH